ncbi:E3 ubiquitin/ISG15 ligase TRIM25-like isoform X2 [Chanodichthys erythropterus]|uniref:E3 ubiquitin/ISG15 ligase TRIM25-like isoform X2 n=1 Tax=Chanodichthys erythropterus TaxID=933992 RepID=UPI00351E54B7
MAEARFSQDEFMCPVCLDLLKDPVTIPCGHSYCKICITGCWDEEDQMRVYSCPQCRQTFSPRPALAKNTILDEMVEKLKKIKLPADCYPGAGDVQCDVCTGRKDKAVKSCLVCLNSYCQTHFDHHEEFHSHKPHKVTEATGRLQEMICRQKHDNILEVFCRTDQKCICLLCMMDEHKNHDTVSAAAQRTEKQLIHHQTKFIIDTLMQQHEVTMESSLMKSLPLIVVIITAAVDGLWGWGVNYSPSYVCALKGSTVKMSCTLKYPCGHVIRTAFWTKHVVIDGEPSDLCSDPENRGEIQCLMEDKDTYSITLKAVTEGDKHIYYCRFTTDINPQGSEADLGPWRSFDMP